jgi:RNA polymerase sigma-70 factor (ECF subfamily)
MAAEMTETTRTDRGDGERPSEEEFPRLTDPYRRELFAHCYRMVGSVHDAEDLVQETYLRAWRAYHGFEGRSSLRTWLYRIATNVCLTALEGKNRRPLPTGLGAAGSTAGDPLVTADEVLWLEPVPDALVADPAEQAATRDTIRLAFVAALQHLPARQRAVLILRDVLTWQAQEVADALDISTAAVNSLLQRARAQLNKAQPSLDDARPALAEEHRELLDRYVTAFWEKDIGSIVALLKQDAIWEMPPYVGWYQGADNIGRLIDTQCPGGTHDMPMVATRANGQPAYGLYMRQPTGEFRPFHLQVLTITDDAVSHVVAFFGPELFETFGLPPVLDGPAVTALATASVKAQGGTR